MTDATEDIDAVKPKVVLVDDGDAADVTLADSRIEVDVWHPADIDDDDFRTDLLSADVVLVDQQLYTEGVLNPPQPTDGVGLLAVLQRYLAATDRGRLVSFALYSGALKEISTSPDETRTHVIARLHGFEWAFPKGVEGDVDAVIQGVASLGLATSMVRAAFHDAADLDERLSSMRQLLKLPDSEWAVNAWSQVLACHPPISSVFTDTSGAAILRWLLHRILPYPTFLYDEAMVAARIGLPIDRVEEMLDGELGALLEGCRYGGVLDRFNGRRYWRAGLEWILSDVAGGDSADSGSVREALTHRLPEALEFIDHPRPVVALDAYYRPLNAAVDPAETLRIRPDDWPAYAEPARVLYRLARENSEIGALVVPGDRQKLKASLIAEEPDLVG